MNNLKHYFLGGLVFSGTVIISIIGFAAYTSLPNQPDGATITQTIWNNVIDKINLLGTDIDSVKSSYSQLGVGQTRQDLTSSRILGTTYTNNTGKPISIEITSNGTSIVTNAYLYINNTLICVQNGQPDNHARLSGIIPNGGTYYITGATIYKWLELR
ncbi:MAG: hypothetical protein PHR68_02845 [Candidatus Gracilibacteria bacterium]|nr:hypothetical protein [Candidatus Gracilibacteria bacterium]